MKERWARIRASAKKLGINKLAISKDTGIPRQTVQNALRDMGLTKEKPLVGGSVKGLKTHEKPLPTEGVKRYIFTAAQNNTRAHTPFLENLEALAKHYKAEIHVSRFDYNKSAWRKSTKPGTADEAEDTWYDPRLAKYFSDKRLQIAPGLIWCGEMNILPTAERPLSGFETYTGRASGIFPHAKIAMESIISMKDEGTKFNYTTGAVTVRNYIQKKAGLKAEFHHAFGALLVEIDAKGTWFCRQLNATSDGTFYDLTLRVRKGRVSSKHRAAAINWGDTHAVETDETVKDLAWGPGGMLDVLMPKDQFHNDLFSMRARGHHDLKNCHVMFKRHVDQEGGVYDEVVRTVDLVKKSMRKFCRTRVVDSNHDQHLTRWLREGDFKTDPINARFYLQAQDRYYAAIEEKDEDFHLLEWVLRRAGCPKEVHFLRQDESFIICKRAGDGIECGMHGDLGPNGARGSARGLSRLSRRANIGHSHSAQIVDGVYQAGTSSRLRLDYVKGPSSHSHSHIVTYANGKRAIITMYDGKWRAE